MAKKSNASSADVTSQVDIIKKQIFDLKLAKNISGTYDRKKIKELKNQVISLYSSKK